MVGAKKKKNASPAAPLEPVSVLIHTAAASHNAESPNEETAWPARNTRASRTASSRRAPTLKPPACEPDRRTEAPRPGATPAADCRDGRAGRGSGAGSP